MTEKGLSLRSKRGGGLRGDIEGFSAKAASRLREFCVTMEVPCRVPLAFSLTTHGVMSPKEWRRAMMQFRQRARRAGVPFVYRVELQKRKAPHTHGVAWVAADHREHPEHRRLFWEGWLECVREHDDPDSRRYAVNTREIENEGWTIYIALHDGKHKAEQLGWEGKQWGIVGRHRFKRRAAVFVDLTDSERYRFQRIMRRLLAMRGSKNRVLPSAQTWLRCIDGGTANRLLSWVTSRPIEGVG